MKKQLTTALLFLLLIATAFTAFNFAVASELPGSKNLNRDIIIISIIVYAVLAYIFSKFLIYANIKKSKLYLIIAILSAFFLRLLLALTIAKASRDGYIFVYWATLLNEGSFNTFYDRAFYCDYPPGYLYILYLGGAIAKRFALSELASLMLVKIVPIFCDVITAILLYTLAQKRNSNGLLIALLYLFNPLVIIDGAIWGQIDSVLAMMIVLACYFLFMDKLYIAIPLYTLACLIKPQGLIFGPIALIYLIKIIKGKDVIKQLIISLAISLALFIAVVLPFVPIGSNFTWIFDKYTQTLSSYPMATANTSNLYYLLGLNGVSQRSFLPQYFVIAYFIILGLLSIYTAIKNKHKFLQKENLFITLSILLLVAYTIGVVVVYMINKKIIAFSALNMLTILLISSLLLFALGKDKLPYVLALELILLYSFTVRMHERYIFPAIALFLTDYAYNKDIKALIMGVLSSLAAYVNTAILLDNILVLGTEYSNMLEDTFRFAQFLSAYNIAICALGIYFAFSKDINIDRIFRTRTKKLNNKNL